MQININDNTDLIHKAEVAISVVSAEEIEVLCRYKPHLLSTNPSVDECWQTTLLDFLSYESKRKSIDAKTLHAYVNLCKQTYPVTGASILESQKATHYPLMAIVGIILAICMLGQLTYSYASTTSASDSTKLIWHFAYYFGMYWYPVLAGLLWGGLGSCIYLLKRVNDIAQSREFDPALYKGVWVRMVLGGTLGWVVVNIFDLEANDFGGISIPAVAFLTGLSVKVVYGALEALVVAIEQKLNIGNLRSSASLSKSLKSNLEQLSAAIEGDKDEALLDAISSLKQALNRAKHLP